MPINIKPMMVCKPIPFNTMSFSRDTPAYYYDAGGLLTEADIDELRYGYDPTTLAYIGAIIEGASENVFLRSNDFSNAAWTKSDGAVITSAPAEINPTGAAGCQSFNGVGLLRQANPFSIPEICCVSIYAKSSDDGDLKISGIGSSGICRFDLVSGVVISGAPDASIQKLPNGWYRCSVRGEVTSSEVWFWTTTPEAGTPPEILLYGAQLEFTGSPTSYIPTVATAEERAADLYGDPPAMISSNIPEDDYPDYVPGTTYAAGDKVMVRDTFHRNYQSAADLNTGNYPPSHTGGTTPKWVDIGATNRWRMFDYKVGVDLPSASEGYTVINLAVSDPVSCITLLGIAGVRVQVVMYSLFGAVLYSKEIDILGDPAEPTWWDYLFGRRQIIKNITLTDLPENEGVTIQVVVFGDGDVGPTELAKLIVGDAVVLGYTEYGSSVGIIDYSTKEPDTFGNYIIQERAFVGKADLKVVVSPGYESFVLDTLADLRATPAVYIGNSDYESTIIYGFYKDFSILFSTPADSFCSLTVEGI